MCTEEEGGRQCTGTACWGGSVWNWVVGAQVVPEAVPCAIMSPRGVVEEWGHG